MSYVTLAAKLEGYEESSYTSSATGEQHSKIQLTLSIPSMRDKVLCEFDLEHAPSSELLDRWEIDESWHIVAATSYRAMGYTRRPPTPTRRGERSSSSKGPTSMRQALRNASSSKRPRRRHGSRRDSVARLVRLPSGVHEGGERAFLTLARVKGCLL